MDRINGANTIDIGGGRRGFRNEDLPSGTPGTEVTALWLNMLQEEMLSVIEGAGLVADPADWAQFLKALRIFSTRRNGWMPVISMTTAAPPGAPTAGDTYLIPTGATGAWAANVGNTAEWTGTAWAMTAQPNGHGISLPDGRVFIKVAGAYIEKLALDAQSGKWTYAEAAGTANALTADLAPKPASLASLKGTLIIIKTGAAANGGAMTLDLNSFGAANIVHTDGSGMGTGEVPANSMLSLLFDGTRFIAFASIATAVSPSAWTPVLSMTTTAPPGAPAVGDTYLIPAAATGAWAGNDGKTAVWSGSAWAMTAQPNGHGISLPNGQVFIKVAGAYVEKLALDAQSGKWNYAAAGGTANALTATLAPVPASLASIAGSPFVIKTGAAANSGAMTLDLNGFGAKNIVHTNGRAMMNGEVPANSMLHLDYDGTSFVAYATPIKGLGDDQTWQDMTASRAPSTVYQNTTGRPIQVAVSSGTDESGKAFVVSLDGTTWLQIGFNTFGSGSTNTVNMQSSGPFTIPNGAYYRGDGNLGSWRELR